jgi:hypothetical protein
MLRCARSWRCPTSREPLWRQARRRQIRRLARLRPCELLLFQTALAGGVRARSVSGWRRVDFATECASTLRSVDDGVPGGNVEEMRRRTAKSDADARGPHFPFQRRPLACRAIERGAAVALGGAGPSPVS